MDNQVESSWAVSGLLWRWWLGIATCPTPVLRMWVGGGDSLQMGNFYPEYRVVAVRFCLQPQPRKCGWITKSFSDRVDRKLGVYKSSASLQLTPVPASSTILNLQEEIAGNSE